MAKKEISAEEVKETSEKLRIFSALYPVSIETIHFMEQAALQKLKEGNPDTNVVEFTAFSAGFLSGNIYGGNADPKGKILVKKFKQWKSQNS